MDGHLGTSLTHPIGIFGLLGRAGVPWSVGRGLSASQLVGEGLALRRQGKDMRRIGDVLQPLLAEIDELGGDRAPHMAPGVSRDADAAGRREPFEARDDIDAVAVDVVRRDNDVAEIDTDAELDAAVLRQQGVASANDPLHIQRAAYRIDHTR